MQHIFNLRIEHEDFLKIEAAAQAEYQSINQWCYSRLMKAVADHEHNKMVLALGKLQVHALDLDRKEKLVDLFNKDMLPVKVQPGEDVIVQRRDSKGRFEKKS